MSENELNKLTLGLKIKELRMRRGISQREFAKMLGVTPGRLSNWENGYSFPDFKYLPEISCNLNCSYDYLLGVTFNNNYADLIGGFELLNDEGRKKVIEYITDLSLIPKYCFGNEYKEGNELE